MKTKFKPNGNWIVLPDPVVTETKSGIILDEKTAQANAKRSNILKIISCGPNCIFVKKGNTVMIDPRTEATRMAIDGAFYLMVQEHQILGKW